MVLRSSLRIRIVISSARGFSVDGSVRIEATDRAGRERLLRYCARPPLALDRLREHDRHSCRGPGRAASRSTVERRLVSDP